MNQNTEYEIFTQQVYQLILNYQGVKNVEVKHNVKLKGISGQGHQIDVYWEYEMAGITVKVAIECKNYNRYLYKGVVCAFKGVLDDLPGVRGVIVTKKGYQRGAKKIADCYKIELRELREPEWGETIIGELENHLDSSVIHTLFEVDEDWAYSCGYDLRRYCQRLDSMNQGFRHRYTKHLPWSESKYLPFQTKDDNIYDSENHIIDNTRKMFENLPELTSENPECLFSYDDAYIILPGDEKLKIKAVLFSYEESHEIQHIQIDAGFFVKAIMKDTLKGTEQKILKF